jgi:hypothetical protein
MTCPVCGLENPAGGAKCDCGYGFVTRIGGAEPPFSRRYRALLIIIGPILALLFLVFLWGQLGVPGLW